MPLPTMRRRFLALPLALAALGVAACGSSSKTTSSASTSTTATSAATTPTAGTSVLVGAHTSVALNPATSQLLKENVITVTAVGPATYSKTLVLPVSGGQIAVATLAGTIDHNGGIKLSHGEKSVEVTTFIVDTSTKQVTALIGEQRMPVFAINTSSEKRKSETGGTIVDSGLKLTLTEQAASALNGALGVSAFKAGQVFGTATITLAVKP